MYKEKFFVIIVTIGCINCVYIFPYIAPEAVARRAAPEKRRMIRAGLPLTARKSRKTAGSLPAVICMTRNSSCGCPEAIVRKNENERKS